MVRVLVKQIEELSRSGAGAGNHIKTRHAAVCEHTLTHTNRNCGPNPTRTCWRNPQPELLYATAASVGRIRSRGT